MADIWSVEKRSEVMSRIRGGDTKPERHFLERSTRNDVLDCCQHGLVRHPVAVGGGPLQRELAHADTGTTRTMTATPSL